MAVRNTGVYSEHGFVVAEGELTYVIYIIITDTIPKFKLNASRPTYSFTLSKAQAMLLPFRLD